MRVYAHRYDSKLVINDTFQMKNNINHSCLWFRYIITNRWRFKDWKDQGKPRSSYRNNIRTYRNTIRTIPGNMSLRLCYRSEASDLQQNLKDMFTKILEICIRIL